MPNIIQSLLNIVTATVNLRTLSTNQVQKPAMTRHQRNMLRTAQCRRPRKKSNISLQSLIGREKAIDSVKMLVNVWDLLELEARHSCCGSHEWVRLAELLERIISVMMTHCALPRHYPATTRTLSRLYGKHCHVKGKS